MTEILEAVSPRDDKGNDPNDHRQDQGYMRRILGNASTIPGVSRDFQFIGLTQIRKGLKGTDYLVKPFLERDTTVVFFGESGTYKSFIALDLGLSIAFGVPYHDYPTHQGAVFYLCGEGKGGIARRVEAWLIKHQLKQQTAPFYVSELPAQLIESGNAEAVATTIQKIATGKNPAFIIIDTLSTNIGNGDESNNADIARLLVNVNTHIREQFKACVMFVHHVGHSDKERERGAYALRGNADTRILVKPYKGGCSLHSMKNKDGAPFQPIAFEPSTVVIPRLQDSEGELVTSLTMGQIEYIEPTKEAALPHQQAQALAVLKDIAPATPADWKAKLISLKVIKGKSTKQIFYRLKKALLEAELIVDNCGLLSPAEENHDEER
ncbi:MAG: AAA family ATPase [Thiotrichaceae bacterium]